MHFFALRSTHFLNPQLWVETERGKKHRIREKGEGREEIKQRKEETDGKKEEKRRNKGEERREKEKLRDKVERKTAKERASKRENERDR